MKLKMLKSIKKLTITRWINLATTVAVSTTVFACVASASNVSADSKQTQTNKPSLLEETIKGKPFVVTKMIVSAPVEQVWKVLSDFKNATHVFPMIRKFDVVEDHGSTKTVKQVFAPTGVPNTTYEYTLQISQTAPKIMEWHRISGDFKQVDGFWKLESAEAGRSTLVTYASYVDGGFFLPQMLIKRQARIDMPIAMTALKDTAETNNQIASRSVSIGQ